MMGKHTVGPWSTKELANYAQPGWVVTWPDTSKPGVHNRRLDYNGSFTEADARLIAAAPELLEALEDAIHYIAAIMEATEGDKISRSFLMSMTAIKKARGE